MRIISLVAAIDENRGLSNKGQLLCHLPADLKYFKDLTIGKPIIMGRRTYESIGAILPGRLNIILSNQQKRVPGAIVTNSLQKALEFGSNEAEIFIIGGSVIFEQALSLASRIYLTFIHQKFVADTFFPRLDAIWRCKHSILRQKDQKNAYDLTFYIYERLFSVN